MAQDEVSLYNLALSAVGARDSISIPSEASREGEICRLWYEPVRNHILRAAHWPSAKAYQRSGVLATRDDTIDWMPGDPEPGWKYTYNLPGDFLYPQHLSTYEKFTTGVLPAGENVMFSSAEQALLFYTKKQDLIASWDAQLYMAVSLGLGAAISNQVHGKVSLARDAREQADTITKQARASAANEEHYQWEVMPEWIQARGYTGTKPNSNLFIYPFGPLLGEVPGGLSAN